MALAPRMPVGRTPRPVVAVSGAAYLVTLPNRSTHRVGKDKRCDCGRGPHCPAVNAVAAYRRAGGQQAPDPAPVAESAPASAPALLLRPPVCPICGAATQPAAPGLSPTAFTCPNGAGAHWFEWRAQEVLARRAQAPMPAWWPKWTAEERAAWLQERYDALLALYAGGPAGCQTVYS